MTQARNGKAFEYALAQRLSLDAGADINDDASLVTAKNAYESLSGSRLRPRFDLASENMVRFLLEHDERLSKASLIRMQSDEKGKMGDVRDLVIDCEGGQVGISAKHNHAALKHSRLSGSIDFGKEWGGHSVSDTYWATVRPVFEEMKLAKEQDLMFRDIENKVGVYYLPVLTAFENELKRLCEEHGRDFIGPMFRYVVGKQDYYKATCYPKLSELMSMNINGTCLWGKKWKIPSQIDTIRRDDKKASTLIVSFEYGWRILFRLHSARSRVEPSLKFDINFEGTWSNAGQHQIPHKSAAPSSPKAG